MDQSIPWPSAGWLGQPRWRRYQLDQPLVNVSRKLAVPPESDATVAFLPATAAEGFCGGACVVIVRARDEFVRALREPVPGAEWLQVEGLLSDPEVWAIAAQGAIEIPLDVVVTDPAAEFSSLYRLADVRLVRDVRVTIPAKVGCMKALRLAASLQLPVRILPGQPSPEELAELAAVVDFYLHNPMVEAPVEFLHSVLAVFLGTGEGTLWTFLEQDPDVFQHYDAEGRALLAPGFADNHLASLIDLRAECATCRWQAICAGYFKWPDAAYDCAGVKEIFATIEAAAEEIRLDLATHESVAAP